MKWLIGIIVPGVLYLLNAVYRFLPDGQSGIYIVAAIAAAIIIVGHYFNSNVLKSGNYSYALILENGQIKEKKNFRYEISFQYDPYPEYTIVNLSNPRNMTIQPYKAVTPELSEMSEGVKIRFISAGEGNPLVTARFKVELDE